MHSLYQNPFEHFHHIYYINLDSRPDRNEQTLAEFAKYNISAERVSGVLNSTPEHGCHLSHAKIFADAVEHDYDNILIFEDDVEFFPNAASNLRYCLVELPDSWDMLYLGANLDRFPAYQVSSHLAKLTGAYATHAYAVRKNMFSILFNINSDPDVVHNDVTYSEVVHPIYNCYMTLPLLAGQRDGHSDIQGKFMSSNQVFLTRLETNLVRL